MLAVLCVAELGRGCSCVSSRQQHAELVLVISLWCSTDVVPSTGLVLSATFSCRDLSRLATGAWHRSQMESSDLCCCADLVPRDVAEQWVAHLRTELPTLAFKSSQQRQRTKLAQKRMPRFKDRCAPQPLLVCRREHGAGVSMETAWLQPQSCTCGRSPLLAAHQACPEALPRFKDRCVTSRRDRHMSVHRPQSQRGQQARTSAGGIGRDCQTQAALQGCHSALVSLRRLSQRARHRRVRSLHSAPWG